MRIEEIFTLTAAIILVGFVLCTWISGGYDDDFDGMA